MTSAGGRIPAVAPPPQPSTAPAARRPSLAAIEGARWSGWRRKRSRRRLAMESLLATADRQLEVAEHDISLANLCLDVNAVNGAPAVKREATASIKDPSLRPSLEQRLLGQHVEDSARGDLAWSSHLNPCSNLLTTLCRRENPDRLVLTLKAGGEGYSLHVATHAGGFYELLQLPFEERSLLDCIDNQVRNTPYTM